MQMVFPAHFVVLFCAVWHSGAEQLVRLEGSGAEGFRVARFVPIYAVMLPDVRREVLEEPRRRNPRVIALAPLIQSGKVDDFGSKERPKRSQRFGECLAIVRSSPQ